MRTDIFCKSNSEAAQRIESAIMSADKIAIVGHVRPDGDDVGTCLGLAGYIRIIKPGASVKVFLEKFNKSFDFLPGASEVCHDFSRDESFDLCFMCDCADVKRMGDAAKYFIGAKEKICIDHHATNDGTAEGFAVIEPDRSSSSEVLCTLIDMDKLTSEVAECIYLGIVHDSGVFKYSSTSPETMLYAAKLLELGVRGGYIIDNTFYTKTFVQNKAIARALSDANLLLGGKVIYSVFTNEMMEEYGVSQVDLDSVSAMLREIEGVVVSFFIYETSASGTFKISLRSNEPVDVSKVAVLYGGGGHVRASGCEITASVDEIVSLISREIEKQI